MAQTSPSPRAGSPVLVLVAMAEEAAPIVRLLEDSRELPSPFPGSDRPVTAVGGRLGGREVVVATCGIGLAAASAVTAWGVFAHAPAAVISAGSAGGLAADVEVGTLVVGEACRYSIADATAFGYEPGQVPGQPAVFETDPGLADVAVRATTGLPAVPAVRRGEMLSGDAFVTAPLAGPMRERFPAALSTDMESAAIAQTCRAMGVPFLSVRAISDLCGPRAGQQFHLELDVVAETSAVAVEALLAAL